jgi:hypothetical protein
MATQIATPNKPKQDLTVEQKIQQLRQAYADAPQFAKTALENTLKDLTSTASQPRSRMESAGRTGSRQGTVSELTVIAPFAPGGAARLRAFLQARNGNFDDTDKVGTVHDMRFVLLDNDTKMLFATAYDGDWDVYIEDFVAKIPNEMDVIFVLGRLAGDSQPEGERLDCQAPDHGRRLVRRQSGSDGGGDPKVESRRQGA